MPRSFLVTDEQRRRVRALAGFGMRHAQIAEVVGVGCATTLRKHFREELTRGPADAIANVRKTLFQMATSGRHPAATMFWLKTRAGWSEKGRVPEPIEDKLRRPEIVVSFVKPRQRFLNGEMVVEPEHAVPGFADIVPVKPNLFRAEIWLACLTVPAASSADPDCLAIPIGLMWFRALRIDDVGITLRAYLVGLSIANKPGLDHPQINYSVFSSHTLGACFSRKKIRSTRSLSRIALIEFSSDSAPF